MGVPITFLDKYNPDQFEILGYEKSHHLQTKTYEMQVQVDTTGKRSNVTKLNDGVAIKVDRLPIDATYYIVVRPSHVALWVKLDKKTTKFRLSD